MSALVKDLRIYPSYGKNKAAVTWLLDESIATTAKVYVWRSFNGATEWTLLNTTPVVGTNEYLDSTMVVRNLENIPHYRLAIMLEDDSVIKTEPVGLFNRIRRREYGIIGTIMGREFRAALRDGVKLLHYIPLTTGVPCGGYDHETNQELGSCDDECYGQKYKGGFAKPFLTVGRFFVPNVVKRDQQHGLGEISEVVVQARLLAYPRPQRDHMLVNFETDDRYVITEKINPSFFKSTVPVVFNAVVELLDRNDSRYRVPLPAEIPALASAPFDQPINTTELYPQ